MKIQDPLGNQTLMKLNAQLRHEGQDEAPQPPPIHVELPTIASSSQTAPPPPQFDAALAQILASLKSLQGGMSSMQLRFTLLTSVWSNASWISRSVSSTIICFVMTRIIHLLLRRIDYFVWCFAWHILRHFF
jgi:hypothetical protein